MGSHARSAGLLLAGLLAPLSAHAVVVSVADLPDTIQSCVTGTTCSVVYGSSYDSATASAFQIYNVGRNSVDYLVRYALVAPSGEAFSSTDLYQNPPVTTSGSSPFMGYLWMQVQGSYSASQTADPITVYLDRVSPVPSSFYGHSGDLSLSVSASDLLAGGSHVNSGLDSSNQGYVSGNLSGDVPIGCAAPGCSAFAQLNLAQLQFTLSGTTIVTGFNPADSRGLVFAMGAADDGSVSGYATSITQSFYISPVPDSDPVWLFSSGLICLAAVMRRRGMAFT